MARRQTRFTRSHEVLPPAKLGMPKAEARGLIIERMAKGEDLKCLEITSREELRGLRQEQKVWNDWNKNWLRRAFTNDSIAEEYDQPYAYGTWSGSTLQQDVESAHHDIDRFIVRLRSILERLDLMDEEKEDPSNHVPTSNPRTHSKRVFIGHGRSEVWKDLQYFIQNRLRLEWEEFNREPTAGITTQQRLEEMLNKSSFAFLIMTAEDEHSDASFHARESVIHEIGLFQGRLGFRRAIVLLEEGCSEFSNIHGVTQIRFPKGDIKGKFEDLRAVLEREQILKV